MTTLIQQAVGLNMLFQFIFSCTQITVHVVAYSLGTKCGTLITKKTYNFKLIKIGKANVNKALLIFNDYICNFANCKLHTKRPKNGGLHVKIKSF